MDTETYITIKDVLQKFDPESLIRTGSSPDVYNLVAYKIANIIYRETPANRSLTSEEITNIVAIALHTAFSAWHIKVSYSPLLHQIGEAIKSKM